MYTNIVYNINNSFVTPIKAIIVAVIEATLISLTQIISKEVHEAWKKEQKTKIVWFRDTYWLERNGVLTVC